MSTKCRHAFYWGFGGHGQLSPEILSGEAFLLSTDIHSSFCIWNKIIVVSSSRLSATILGYLEGNSGIRVETKLPNAELFKKVTCCRDKIFALSDSDSVWEFTKYIWKPLKNSFNRKIQHIVCNDKILLGIADGQVLNLSSGCTVDIPDSVITIACGAEHYIALTHCGDVYSWGCATRGQLGRGELESSEIPLKIEGLSGLGVIQISCGSWHNAALTRQGDLYCWGWNRDAQLAVPCPPQLGCTSAKNYNTEDNESESVLASPHVVDIDVSVKQVACGSRHTVVLTADGNVLGCGWTAQHQLGNLGLYSTSSMTKLTIPEGKKVNSISAGGWGTIVLTEAEQK